MYLKHDDLRNYYCYDLEADGLNPTQIWCVVVQNIGSNEKWRFHGSNLRRDFSDFVKRAGPTAVYVGHNIIAYDNRVAWRLAGVDIPLERSVDTMVLSYLYHPSMPGGHSLEAYGERFGVHKVVHEDWSKFTPEMLHRCEVDVDINVRVFKVLTSKMRKVGFSEQSCDIEHHAADIIADQRERGFYFDLPAADALHARIRHVEHELADSIHELFPPVLTMVKEYPYRLTKDGRDTHHYQRHVEQYPKVVRNHDKTRYRTFDYKEFNIGSPLQRVEKLLGLGYQPTKFTDAGNPSVDEESLVEFAKESGIKEVQAIADWLVANSRANMVVSWSNNVREDGAIHGFVASCGANSRRMTHSGPNTANIPGNEAKYGHDCRSLWIPRPGLVQVGADAKSAQMRVFAHYLPDPKLGARFYDGSEDPHQTNADLIGIARKPIKNVFYANMFGAQAPKLARTAGYVGDDKSTAKHGKWIQGELYRVTPGLRELTEDAQHEQSLTSEGWIRCLDGGYVRCPTKHGSLNYRIQSGEAVLQKLGSKNLRRLARAKGLKYWKTGDIHDEWQFEADKRDANELGLLCKQALREAGEQLNFRVPYDGDYKIGKSWADTH